MITNNKKGIGIFWGIAIPVIVLIVIYLVSANWSFFSELFKKDTTTILTRVPQIINDQFSPTSSVGKNFVALIGNVLGFVVGEVPVKDGNTGMSAFIVIVCIWAMIALVFGDILRNFASLSKNICYPVGILLAIAAANLGMIAGFVSRLTGFFAGFGMAAIYLGLGASFVAFVVVEMGIGKFAPWIMRRKSMQEAIKAKHTTGTILDAIKHYKEVGKELSS